MAMMRANMPALLSGARKPARPAKPKTANKRMTPKPLQPMAPARSTRPSDRPLAQQAKSQARATGLAGVPKLPRIATIKAAIKPKLGIQKPPSAKSRALPKLGRKRGS